jgi:N-acetylglucosaminyldiphosphoundecaprenol N-acetyl-beta-D-mannosaminyltransferase
MGNVGLNALQLRSEQLFRGLPEELLDPELRAQPTQMRVATLNMQHLALAARPSHQFAMAMANMSTITADGRPIYWALRRHASLHAVAGSRICAELFSSPAKLAMGVYIVGSTESVHSAARARAKGLGVELSGSAAPSRDSLTDETYSAGLVRDINSSGARIVLVCLGVPRQELWIHLNSSQLKAEYVLGVGGSLDMLFDGKSRAPEWLQRIGLEWLFRLLREPKRLWRRYLVEYPYGLPILVSLWRRGPR